MGFAQDDSKIFPHHHITLRSERRSRPKGRSYALASPAAAAPPASAARLPTAPASLRPRCDLGEAGADGGTGWEQMLEEGKTVLNGF